MNEPVSYPSKASLELLFALEVSLLVVADGLRDWRVTTVAPALVQFEI